ncbi:MAG TPA: bifunctional demethylmenaquinone methyltransferase/2-methoxy-6-polyprenyl-1,4-benzoquinol methylase UbiE [Sutterella sp.]|nr:bifunctional demethylmenaquinone methyltransferase/2-methoxy-6-polyprenyl-1,4-benzoquinol methylase UbiE [Sutterella sp.]
MTQHDTKTTDFGFKDIPEDQKAQEVHAVFDSIAANYDRMNDILSFGLHRVWKKRCIESADLKPGMKVLDLASGTADLAMAEAERVGDSGEVYATDVNQAMLDIGAKRIEERKLPVKTMLCDAEAIGFEDNHFDVVTVSFGLRNMTHKDRVLSEMLRVLKPGGRALILEFSKVNAFVRPFYDIYSLRVMPLIGKWVAHDEESYRYLPESIRRHPSQEVLAEMMGKAGFTDVTWRNFTFGVCALHIGKKP